MNQSQPDRGDDATLRLCLASLNYAPYFGGAAVRFSRYLPGFRRRGVETGVFASIPRSAGGVAAAPRRDAEVLPAEPFEGFPVHRVAFPDVSAKRQFVLYQRELSRFCRAPENRPDVLHVLNLHRASIPYLLQLRRAGIPIVTSSTQIGSHDRTTLVGQYQYWTFRVMFHVVDAVIASTDVMRDWLVERGVRKPIHVIYNGVDLERFHPAGDEAGRMSARRALGIGADERVVIWVGATEERKRLDLMLRAWRIEEAAGRRLHVVVLGPTAGEASTDPYQRTLRELVSEGPSERVHFPGSVDDIERYYRAADLFALSSSREGMNNAIFEAMATRLPVLTTDFEGRTGAHGRPGEHYRLVESTPEAFASGMRELLEDGAAARRLGEAGLQWARDHVDVECSLDQHVTLYRELAGRG